MSQLKQLIGSLLNSISKYTTLYCLGAGLKVGVFIFEYSYK